MNRVKTTVIFLFAMAALVPCGGQNNVNQKHMDSITCQSLCVLEESEEYIIYLTHLVRIVQKAGDELNSYAGGDELFLQYETKTIPKNEESRYTRECAILHCVPERIAMIEGGSYDTYVFSVLLNVSEFYENGQSVGHAEPSGKWTDLGPAGDNETLTKIVNYFYEHKENVIITHSEHDTFEFPACNHEPVISLLKKYALLKETNPTHQDETNEVNTIFLRALHGLNTFTDTEKNHLRTKALLMLYDNSVAIFEDATDYDRMAIRKSLCYMTLSLLSDEYRYQSFTKDAINSVSDILPERKYQQIALIGLLEILMMHQFDNITPKEIEEKWKNLQHFFKTGTTYFDKEFMDDFDYLCNSLWDFSKTGIYEENLK